MKCVVHDCTSFFPHFCGRKADMYSICFVRFCQVFVCFFASAVFCGNFHALGCLNGATKYTLR